MSAEQVDTISKDRKEVDEFNRRLLEKDLENTKRASHASTGTVDDASKYLSESKKRDLVPELREVSRQVYLEKRQKQKMELLKQELEDEQMVFSDNELTSAEREDRRRKKECDGSWGHL